MPHPHKRLLYYSLLITSLLTLAACDVTRHAQQIQQHYNPPSISEGPIANSLTVKKATFDQAWEAIIEFFASRQISIETLEKDSGIVVARRMLTLGSNGDGTVELGDIHTRRSIVKQKMTPVAFAGSGNPAIVRATGKITSSAELAESVVSDANPPMIPCEVRFNVFVRRFADAGLKLTINVDVSATTPVKLWNGWVWRDFLEKSDLKSKEELITLMKPHVTPTEVAAAPRSTGHLESTFLQSLKEALEQ